RPPGYTLEAGEPARFKKARRPLGSGESRLLVSREAEVEARLTSLLREGIEDQVLLSGHDVDPFVHPLDRLDEHSGDEMCGPIDLECDSRLRANGRAASVRTDHELADGVVFPPVGLGPVDMLSLPGFETDIAHARANICACGGTCISKCRAGPRMRDVESALNAADAFAHGHQDGRRLALVVDGKPRHDRRPRIQERLLEAEHAGGAPTPWPEDLASDMIAISELTFEQ